MTLDQMDPLKMYLLEQKRAIFQQEAMLVLMGGKANTQWKSLMEYILKNNHREYTYH